MDNKNYRNLLRHSFWGNFDTGVIFLFLSLYIWDKTEDMITIAIAFIIPVLINTVIDYYFSHLSDRNDRIRYIIIGNIGSSVFLSLYGVADSIYLLYLFIFFKSLFAKLYISSLEPFQREVIEESKYKEFISQENIKISTGASIGGFALMFIYMYSGSIPLIFMISGLIELYSTVYLFRLENVKQKMRKKKEDRLDLNWIKEMTIIYTIKAFGTALLLNRIIIYLYDLHYVGIELIGLIFFIVYGISNIVAARIYDKFRKIPLKNMLVLSFVLQAILLLLFTHLQELVIIIDFWFMIELISNVSSIYSDDRINKSLFTDIGKRLSKFRVTIAIGGILG